MKKQILLVFALGSALALSACSGNTSLNRMAPASGEPVAVESEVAAPGDAKQTRRYIALKHSITLAAPVASLPGQLAAIQAECLKLGCEILGVSQFAEARGQPAMASLSARVPPAAFPGFFSSAQAHGKLISHQSTSEDKTAEVIDVEARLKNLEALKARVLDLLAKRAGTLKDMLDAEKQLAETQAALDSINGQRRALASQTDMVRVDIELVAESLRNKGNWAAPVAEALDESGTVLMTSMGALITLAVALLPWVLVCGALFFPLRRLWRRRRAAKAAMAQAGK